MIKPIGPAVLPPAKLAPKAAIAKAATVRVAADTEPEKPKGFFGGIADWMLEKKRNIDKLPFWEKALIGVVGFVVGWKVNEWVHRQLEKGEGERYDKYGQDQYTSLKAQGPNALVAALSEKHTFKDQLTDPLALKWKAFCTWTVLAEIDNPTIDANRKPVALVALASNTTANKDALNMLAAGIRTRINGTPAKEDYYKPVIEALKATHNITV